VSARPPLQGSDWESDVMAQIAAHEDSILEAAMAGATLCPNCRGKGLRRAGSTRSGLAVPSLHGNGDGLMAGSERESVPVKPILVNGHKTWCAIFHRSRAYCNCGGPHEETP
jgi:hypothetical protein